MMRKGINFAGLALAATLAACNGPSTEAVSENCVGLAQQECLIVALRDCKLLTSAKQEEFNACEPYKECSDNQFQQCMKEGK
jgi:hypothetical protein